LTLSNRTRATPPIALSFETSAKSFTAVLGGTCGALDAERALETSRSARTNGWAPLTAAVAVLSSRILFPFTVRVEHGPIASPTERDGESAKRTLNAAVDRSK
jgi:hypothetical protein